VKRIRVSRNVGFIVVVVFKANQL